MLIHSCSFSIWERLPNIIWYITQTPVYVVALRFPPRRFYVNVHPLVPLALLSSSMSPCWWRMTLQEEQNQPDFFTYLILNRYSPALEHPLPAHTLLLCWVYTMSLFNRYHLSHWSQVSWSTNSVFNCQRSRMTHRVFINPDALSEVGTGRI